MNAFLSKERFGHPQAIAAVLLLIFLAQCFWLTVHAAPEIGSAELFRVEEGLRQWHGEPIAGVPADARVESATIPPAEIDSSNGFDPNHSPLWYLILSAPLLQWHTLSNSLPPKYFAWLERVPFLLFGLLLGASLWYVARRLYGNAGGYIALMLYCFSPAMIRSAALWGFEPEMGAAWGAFGAIFTGIAVAHTLYAPREVVLWNWRRIVLLGLSLALGVGCQFSVVAVAPLVLMFMLYLAPARRRAAFVIWLAACGFALLLLFACYGFHFVSFFQGMRHAQLLPNAWRALAMREAYLQAGVHLSQSGPALVLLFPSLLLAYLLWRRARYFGNTAPLLIAGLFVALGLTSPHYPGRGFQLIAVPFLMLFASGVAADLLESGQRTLTLVCLWTALAANAMWNLFEISRIAG